MPAGAPPVTANADD